MKDFDYDIDKYITYRKKLREGAKEQKFRGNLEFGDIIDDLKTAKQLCSNITKNQLSENAKRFIHDIEKGVL
jgi:hypothetical protein